MEGASCKEVEAGTCAASCVQHMKDERDDCIMVEPTDQSTEEEVADPEAEMMWAAKLREKRRWTEAMDIYTQLSESDAYPESSVPARARCELGLLVAGMGKQLEARKLLCSALDELRKHHLPEELRARKQPVLQDHSEVSGSSTVDQAAGPVELSCAHAEYKLALLTRSTPKELPLAFVRELFDGFAESFDYKLCDRLGYRAPELLCAALLKERAKQGESVEAPAFEACLDLGAGTGLLGAALRAHCTRLEAVELSPEMARRAVEKEVYDEVHVGDILESLHPSSKHAVPVVWDLVAACDVLVYIGCLKVLFQAVAETLGQRQEALLGFTTEIMEPRSAKEMKSFRLNENGRYEYTPGYVEDVAREHRLRVRSCSREVLRKNYGADVWGHVWVLSPARVES
eukprot:TRINITY_DN55833_c0_g1_i1.p1 TRINITY_DN55833_c0_g1~~TRINITY_DN55833_c0_g1_i1.p1  ORF type:complete len:437 (-),score=79.68 TRINITY_DN55833_c0_g1_i1:89-1291(-)